VAAARAFTEISGEAGQGHGPVKEPAGFADFAAGYKARQIPGVYMQRALRLADRGFVLNAPRLKLSKGLLFHIRPYRSRGYFGKFGGCGQVARRPGATFRQAVLPFVFNDSTLLASPTRI
jgi:hypothetical protein